MEKKPRVAKHLKRPVGYTSKKFLLPNSSITFTVFLFTERKNYWNYYSHSELQPTSKILEFNYTQ